MTRTNIIYYTHNNNNFEALLGLLNLEYQRNNSLEVIINQTRYIVSPARIGSWDATGANSPETSTAVGMRRKSFFILRGSDHYWIDTVRSFSIVGLYLADWTEIC